MASEAPAGEDGGLFEPIFTTDALLAATADRAWLAAMAEFETALADAQRELGIIPAEAAAAIGRACANASFDPAALGRRARLAGNPVVAFVRELGAAVGPDAAGWVHFGATSQDVLDSAAMLVARRAGALICAELDRAAQACAALAVAHRGSVMAGRTLLQQALPVSLGLKAAGWLAAIMDARAGLGRVLEERLALQLGGAAGTLASLGDAGPALTGALAARLGLAEPLLPWHTARARIVELGAALGIVAGTADKIGFDVALLMQSEVGEAFEPAAPGRGGSSTLPHKRNPVHAVSANAAARQAVGLVSVLFQAMHQEHERAAGGWQSEWQPLRDLLRLAGGAAALVADSLAGLEVDAAAMAANLGRTGGVLLAERVMLRLAPLLGRTEAHGVVERASKVALADKSAFADTLLAEDGVAAHLGRAELDALLDPNTYLGASDTYIDRVLAAYARTAADAAAPQG